MNILGIDPGLSGGLCVLNEKGIRDVLKMPICTRPHRKGNYIDLDLILAFIKTNSKKSKLDGIFVERQFILRSQGMSSGSKTMYQSGLLYGLSFTQCDYIDEVNAKDWQTEIFNLVDLNNINKYNYNNETKLKSIAYVEQNYGAHYLFSSKRQTKPSDGLADAICIASYGLLKLTKSKKK
jgi:hypothetical protein